MPSVKERLEISYDEVVGWMAGAPNVKDHIRQNELGKEVVDMSEQMPLQPLVKTSCQRFAFQNGKKDASVRISL
jgi:SPX domain protein involved in polyphosphate accumulation